MTQQAPRVLTNPGSLREAVREVIRQNKSQRYTPTRFVQATGNGEVPGLLGVCTGLIKSESALEWLDKALQQYPNLLTLEDYVMRWGTEWGFGTGMVEYAGALSATFDKIAARTRWIVEDEAPLA